VCQYQAHSPAWELLAVRVDLLRCGYGSGIMVQMAFAFFSILFTSYGKMVIVFFLFLSTFWKHRQSIWIWWFTETSALFLFRTRELPLGLIYQLTCTKTICTYHRSTGPIRCQLRCTKCQSTGPIRCQLRCIYRNIYPYQCAQSDTYFVHWVANIYLRTLISVAPFISGIGSTWNTCVQYCPS